LYLIFNLIIIKNPPIKGEGRGRGGRGTRVYLFGLSVTMPDEDDEDEIDDNRQKLKNVIDDGQK
jgi:hypothetical protein